MIILVIMKIIHATVLGIVHLLLVVLQIVTLIFITITDQLSSRILAVIVMTGLKIVEFERVLTDPIVPDPVTEPSDLPITLLVEITLLTPVLLVTHVLWRIEAVRHDRNLILLRNIFQEDLF